MSQSQTSSATQSLALQHALVGDEVCSDVTVEVRAGRITEVTGSPAAGSVEVPGLTLPGLANCHSHAFHRALRGHTQRGGGSFWTWREQMYAVAAELTPDGYFELAREVYAEMRATGITAVGEFHYLHHQPDGTPYADPNEMGRALLAAADDAGIRIRLLDTCYVSAGFGRAPEGVQVRYSDGDAHAWAERVAAFGDPRVGAAIHSVRAVPRDQLGVVVEAAAGLPLHVHLSEQVAENEECVAAYGLTPTQVLAEAGALGPLTTAVHATHLSDEDIRLLGESRTNVCVCATTERDLGDGLPDIIGLRGNGYAYLVANRKNKRLKAENDILKKAAQIFSRSG